MRCISLFFVMFFVAMGHAGFSQTTSKIVFFYNEISVPKEAEVTSNNFVACGFAQGQLGLQVNKKKEKSVIFSVHNEVILIGKGENVSVSHQGDAGKGGNAKWKYNWKSGSTYKFLITALPDSTSITTTYTAYFFAPELKAWKFIACFRVQKDGEYLHKPSSSVNNNAWLKDDHDNWSSLVPDDNNNGRQIMHDTSGKKPVINLYLNLDSGIELQKEIALVNKAIRKGMFDTTGVINGVWYKIIKEGTGAQITPTDTITCFYKGTILNGAVFDSTKNKPAVFPLNRLIKGFQIGASLCKVGGKIRLIIPSALAYSIRTRAFGIPPNSILVFDIEVLDAAKKTADLF